MQRPQRVQNRPVVRRPNLNLDVIFGHVLNNLTGEPVTPAKVATFYLLRILFQTHFGTRNVRSTTPFDTEEKAIIFQWFYGVTNMEEEMTYKEFRGFMRIAFAFNRNITLNFLAAMEQIGSGYNNINLAMEDEFFTNRHGRACYIPAEELRKELPFTSNQSYIYRWIKRLQAQWAKTTHMQMLQLNDIMRYWINKGTITLKGLRNWHRFIDCSLRSRQWVNHAIICMDREPEFTFSYRSVIKYARIVGNRWKDISEAWLLEAAAYVELKDADMAIKALKKFFDHQMVELNENVVQVARSFRLAVTNQDPLLFAPILHARVSKKFGDYKTARQLLRESIQQAQLKSDIVCHQLANFELQTLETLGVNALLEYKLDETEENREEDPRVQRKTLKHIDNLHLEVAGTPCCSHSEEDFEFVAELDCFGKLLMTLRSIAACTFRLPLRRLADFGIHCLLSHDFESRGRKIEAYGFSIITSNMIRNGMYQQALEHSRKIVQCAYASKRPEVTYTESYAVNSANLVYSLAAAGEMAKAKTILSTMKSKFNEKKRWLSYRHVHICFAIVKFQERFFKNDYTGSKHIISNLITVSELEFNLKQSLVLAGMGRIVEAKQLLFDFKTMDIRGQIRVHMQLATYHTATKDYDKCDLSLAEAMKLAVATSLMDVRGMIKRRRATMLMCREKYADALFTLKNCFEVVTTNGTFFEKACFFMTAARCSRMLNRDPRIWLQHARRLPLKNNWPTMEKAIFMELAALHEPNGLLPDPERLAQSRQAFANIHNNWPGRCDWILI
ncbi:unnamed protein product [Caenorhabditis sp. 36 PRJEB53466]|nr:unnamed protein product [Caenorhabditis sp. 36 PRJEB53466]